MKKILLLTLCMIAVLSSFAQITGVIWEQGTFQEALDKAKANKKGPNLLFLDCYTAWCGPCKYMANNVFTKKEAGDYFNKNFVNIKIDMEKGEGVQLAKRYSISSYPTFLILDANGDEIGRVSGGDELNGFIKKIEAAKEIKNSPRYFKSIYDENKTLKNALTYLKSLESSFMDEHIAVFIAENLSQFKQEQIFSVEMWKYFSQSLVSDNPALLNYLLANKAVANAVIGDDSVNKAIVDAYYKNLAMSFMGLKTLTKEEILEAAKVIKLLAKAGDRVQALTADIAVLYADKNMEEISKIYKFSRFTSYNFAEMQNIERIFGSIKEITKEQIEQFYKDKTEFYTKQIEGSLSWKDMLIKRINNN